MSAESSLAGLKVVVIGGGNMGEALVAGILEKGVCALGDVVVCDVRPERNRYMGERYGVATETDAGAAAPAADVLVLAVKPQDFGELLPRIAGAVDAGRCTVVSIAAGVKTARIERGLGEGVRVVRAMPNLGALAGAGAAAICGGRLADGRDMERAEALLGAVGIVVRVAEEDMDAVTALSGSGPAYVFFLMENMLQAAGRMGLDAGTARVLVLQTVRGAADVCLGSGDDPGDLRGRVTSKGGTTAAAMEVLERRGVAAAFVEAIEAARKRSAELAVS